MAKKIKMAVRRKFAKLFDEEATRRGLEVVDEAMEDTCSRFYAMDTALGRMRLTADGEGGHMLHVARRFEDVPRAREVLGGRHDFNVYSGKWNSWIAGDRIDEHYARMHVERVFSEIDGLTEK